MGIILVRIIIKVVKRSRSNYDYKFELIYENVKIILFF